MPRPTFSRARRKCTTRPIRRTWRVVLRRFQRLQHLDLIITIHFLLGLNALQLAISPSAGAPPGVPANPRSGEPASPPLRSADPGLGERGPAIGVGRRRGGVIVLGPTCCPFSAMKSRSTRVK